METICGTIRGVDVAKEIAGEKRTKRKKRSTQQQPRRRKERRGTVKFAFTHIRRTRGPNKRRKWGKRRGGEGQVK